MTISFRISDFEKEGGEFLLGLKNGDDFEIIKPINRFHDAYQELCKRIAEHPERLRDYKIRCINQKIDVGLALVYEEYTW